MSEEITENEAKRRKKISLALKNNHNSKGHTLTSEQKKHMSKAVSKAIRDKIKSEGYNWGTTGKHGHYD